MSSISMKTPIRSFSTPLRVTNSPYLSCVPFRVWKQIPQIHYEEDTPIGCIHKLEHRETDCALISVASAALSDSCILFPYGVATREETDSVYLFSDLPIEELNTIYIDDRSKTAAILLQILLKEKFPRKNISFIRLKSLDIPQHIHGTSAALIIGTEGYQLRKIFDHSYDLTKLWREHTGLPMVYAIWALQPEKAAKKLCEEIISILQYASDHAQYFVREWAEEIGGSVNQLESIHKRSLSHSFDQHCIDGLREFIRRGRFHGFLPDCDFEIFGEERIDRIQKRSILPFPSFDRTREVLSSSELSSFPSLPVEKPKEDLMVLQLSNRCIFLGGRYEGWYLPTHPSAELLTDDQLQTQLRRMSLRATSDTTIQLRHGIDEEWTLQDYIRVIDVAQAAITHGTLAMMNLHEIHRLAREQRI